jgi:hypothetical protein
VNRAKETVVDIARHARAADGSPSYGPRPILRKAISALLAFARAVSLDQLDDPVPTGWAAHIHFKLCEPSPASHPYTCASQKWGAIKLTI